MAQSRFGFICLNRFPYNTGHLLVAPYRHVADLSDLAPEESLDLLQLVEAGMERIHAVMQPEGFNIGINLGRIAGGSIPDHLHWHVVPRWRGDTNVMQVIGQTKVISKSLDAACRLLRKVKLKGVANRKTGKPENRQTGKQAKG